MPKCTPLYHSAFYEQFAWISPATFWELCEAEKKCVSHRKFKVALYFSKCSLSLVGPVRILRFCFYYSLLWTNKMMMMMMMMMMILSCKTFWSPLVGDWSRPQHLYLKCVFCSNMVSMVMVLTAVHSAVWMCVYLNRVIASRSKCNPWQQTDLPSVLSWGTACVPWSSYLPRRQERILRYSVGHGKPILWRGKCIAQHMADEWFKHIISRWCLVLRKWHPVQNVMETCVGD